MTFRVIPPEDLDETKLISSSISESETWNRLLFENDLTNAVWIKTNSTVSSNTIANPIDGRMNADTLTATAANGQVSQSYTALAQSYTFSVYLRRRTGTGAVSISLDGVTFTTVTLTTSFQKFSVTATLTAGSKSATIRIANNTDSIDVWGAVVVTAFSIGDRVERLSTHSIYQRLTAGNTDTMPENDPVNWVYVQPNNRYALLDTSNSTQTVSNTTISYRFRPGVRLDCIAAFNIQGSSVRFRVISDLGVVKYDQTRGLGTIPQANWYSWFFEPANIYDQFITLDAPVALTDDVLVDIEPVLGVAAVGTFVVGMSRSFGVGMQYGGSFGIQDYSIKQTDQFGQTVFKQRAFAKRARFSIMVDRQQSDQLFYTLTQRRAKPTLYVSTTIYEAGIIFGFYKDFNQVIPYPDNSVFEIELESLA
jgi:hypothetical protein